MAPSKINLYGYALEGFYLFPLETKLAKGKQIGVPGKLR